MTTVPRDYTAPPKADSCRCQVQETDGQCTMDATVKITNADANSGESENMSRRACPQHTDRAFQEVGAMSPAGTPEFLVTALGSLAERIRVLVPAYIT